MSKPLKMREAWGNSEDLGLRRAVEWSAVIKWVEAMAEAGKLSRRA